MASLRDLLSAAGVLKKVAEGDVFGDNSAPVGADNAASATASQNARRNPSGIDMAAEAQKAAARSLPARPIAPAPAAPVVPLKKRPTAAGTIGTALKQQ